MGPAAAWSQDQAAENPSQGRSGRQDCTPAKAPAPGTCSIISLDKLKDKIIKHFKTKTEVR